MIVRSVVVALCSVVSAIIGVVTNIVTDDVSAGLIAALVALVALNIVLQVWLVRRERPSSPESTSTHIGHQVSITGNDNRVDL